MPHKTFILEKIVRRIKVWKACIEWTIEYDGAVDVQSATLALAVGTEIHPSDPDHTSSVLLVVGVRGIASFLGCGEVVHVAIDASLVLSASKDLSIPIAVYVYSNRTGIVIAPGRLEVKGQASIFDDFD